MHDIWNPWHGCVRCSEGCQNCYMHYLDRIRNQDGSKIYKTGAGFRYPLSKDRNGFYKVKRGEQLQSQMAYKSGKQYQGKPIDFVLKDPFGNRLRKDLLYHPQFCSQCQVCGSRLICNGCSNCGRCTRK